MTLIWLLWPGLAFAQITEGPLSASSSVNSALSGSFTAWSSPGNTFISDDSYVTASLSSNGDYTDHLLITGFGFSLAASSLILGIEVEIERFGSNVRDNEIRIVKGGTVGTTDRGVNSSWSNSDNNSYQTYGNSTDLWGETWTASDINASNFGVAISARKQGGGGASVANVDHVRITVYYDVALPVGMLFFNSSRTRGHITLNWATAWESDNSHFAVQRAGDDLSFQTLGFVAGSNTTDEKREYTFTDDSPLTGHNFYRLKQVDFSGTFEYSELIFVDMPDNLSHFQIRPTVITDEAHIHFSSIHPTNQKLKFYSIDSHWSISINIKSSEQRVLRTQFPSPGVYLYRYTQQNQVLKSGKVLIK